MHPPRQRGFLLIKHLRSSDALPAHPMRLTLRYATFLA
jgi:hypothetical protein